jgi:hypothetical protein
MPDPVEPPRPVPPRPGGWTVLHSVGVLAALAGLVAIEPLAARSREAAWAAAAGLLVGLTCVVSLGLTGSWRGMLIDARNRFSLSRLQMLAWTLLVLPAVYAAILVNLAIRAPNPLEVEVPSTLWMLMGLSTTSLAATPLIRTTKESRPADPTQEARTLDTLAARRGDATGESLGAVGQVVVNRRPQDARVGDLFAGEDVGNAALVDLSKVQLAYVTGILWLAYAVALANLFRPGDGSRIAALPGLDSGLVALLGISHIGYLTAKAFPQSRPAE